MFVVLSVRSEASFLPLQALVTWANDLAMSRKITWGRGYMKE